MTCYFSHGSNITTYCACVFALSQSWYLENYTSRRLVDHTRLTTLSVDTAIVRVMEDTEIYVMV